MDLSTRPDHLALSPVQLLTAYAVGLFPMADSADDADIFWVEARERGTIPLHGLHISKSLRKKVRQDYYRVTVDTCFEDVIWACAEKTETRPETWINQTIHKACLTLHDMGYAHSVECWKGTTLVGGVYGIALRGAFFGESMFSRQSDASKVALVHLVARLRAGGFTLLDTQFITPHLTRLGAIGLSRDMYQDRLADALTRTGQFDAVPPCLTGQACLALMTT